MPLANKSPHIMPSRIYIVYIYMYNILLLFINSGLLYPCIILLLLCYYYSHEYNCFYYYPLISTSYGIWEISKSLPSYTVGAPKVPVPTTSKCRDGGAVMMRVTYVTRPTLAGGIPKNFHAT